MGSGFHNLALLHIVDCFRAADSGVERYHLPTSVDHAPCDPPRQILGQLAGHAYNQLQQLYDTNLTQFTNEAFEAVINVHVSLHDEDGGRRRVLPSRAAGQGVFFVNGPGGTGKTFSTPVCWLPFVPRKSLTLMFLLAAWPPPFFPRARTAHSLFMISSNINHDSFCFVEKQSSRAHLLRGADVLC